jgi:outer membrane protein OmpA-like peptidoglycan-associated protein
MHRAPAIAAVVAAAAAAQGIACSLAGASGPGRRGQALVVLLVDDDGDVGRATVSNESGSADLRAERDATHVVATRPPGAVTTLSQEDVEEIFGSALSALPAPARRFTLNFKFESDELTDEARALVPEVLRIVRERQVPDVVVVGHTDTMGSPPANFELGLKRATTVRDLLVDAGLDASVIEVTSLGETDLFIRTGDETPEPRNRRVDIAVR